MERIRSLGRYQKSVLLATALMALVFTAVYLTVTARVGFAFGDAILLDVHEVSADVYTGKVRGETVRFTVNADRSVTFQRGERLYGRADQVLRRGELIVDGGEFLARPGSGRLAERRAADMIRL